MNSVQFVEEHIDTEGKVAFPAIALHVGIIPLTFFQLTRMPAQKYSTGRGCLFVKRNNKILPDSVKLFDEV